MAVRRSDVPTDVTRIERCCPQHPDWATLARHLASDFSDLDIDAVAQELRLAKEAVETVNLHDDPIVMAELIARHRLLVRAGRQPDSARLDPERHAPRSG